MKKRMVAMLVAVAVFLTLIGGVKFRQIQAGMAMAASFQPPPEAVTTLRAPREEWPAALTAIGTVAAVAMTPIAWSRISHPWQYGQCTTSRPQRSRTPGMSGSVSTTPVATSRRRAPTTRPSSNVTVKRSPSRAAEATRPAHTSPPYPRTSDRPASNSAVGLMPSRDRNPCTPAARAFRGSPASITSTERRDRASSKAPFKPAAPPPTTTTSNTPANRSITSVSCDYFPPFNR